MSADNLAPEDEKKISKAIARLEQLACLQLSDELPDALRTEMEAKTFTLVSGWFAKITELDTQDAEPLVNTREFHKDAGEVILRKTWRDDVANANAKRDELLANAPESEHGLFTVPKVLE